MPTAHETFQQMSKELQKLRDEIRLELHLGSMELRDRFEAVEPKVRAFEQRAEQATEDVGDELRQSWSHLKKSLERIRNELREMTRPRTRTR